MSLSRQRTVDERRAEAAHVARDTPDVQYAICAPRKEGEIYQSIKFRSEVQWLT